MPIEHAVAGDFVVTTLSGRVTDAELLAHYQGPEVRAFTGRWLEIVDGTAVTDMAVSVDGQRQLAELFAAAADRLRGGRVAMIASSDVTFGVFRMWELRRQAMPYVVRVFRDADEARDWIRSEAVTRPE